jgi:hypothetical protein
MVTVVGVRSDTNRSMALGSCEGRAPLSASVKRVWLRRRVEDLERHGRIEETVSCNDVSGGAGFFEDANGGLGDDVVCNDVVVAGNEDAGFGAVENVIVMHARLIALQANAVEKVSCKSFVTVDRSIAAINEDIDLADASRVAGDLHAIGLRDENIRGDRGAGGDRGTRRPDVAGHHILENRSRRAKTNLNSILCRTGGCAYTCGDIPANDREGAFFIGGDAILLKVVNSTAFDFRFRDATIAALHQDAGAALVAIE